MDFLDFVSRQQWTYYATVVALLAPWYLTLLAMARRAHHDIRGEFWTAVVLIGVVELGVSGTAAIMHLAGASTAWLAPVHTFVLLPLAWLVLGVAAASSERRRFHWFAGAAFASHLLYAIGMLLVFAANGEIVFIRPWALLVLLALPVFVWLWWRSLALLEGVRRGAALVLRMLLLAVLAIAAGAPQAVKTNDAMAVVFVVDRSFSMPGRLLPDWYTHWVGQKMELIEADRRGTDKYAVVVFAGEPALVQRLTSRESARLIEPEDLSADVTDLAAAVRQALAVFPDDTRKRIVLVTDGNANRGDVLSDLQMAQHYGVTIDSVVVRAQSHDADVRIERLDVPAEVREGQRFQPQLVIWSTTATEATLTVSVNGVPETMPEAAAAQLRDLTEERQLLLDETPVDEAMLEVVDGKIAQLEREYPPPVVHLQPGRNYPMLPARQYGDPGFYELTVELDVAAEHDGIPQNNSGTAFTVVRGQRHILFVHGGLRDPHRAFVGELEAVFAADADANDEARPTLEVREAARMPRSVSEWRLYDLVLLSDVAAAEWKEDQQRALVAAIQRFGTGLLMLGGPNSYAAGGYHGQPLVEALPVRMELQEHQFIPSGALVIVLHTCEFPDWNRHTKTMCIAALDALSDRDQFGIVIYDYGAGRGSSWLFPLAEVGGQREQMRRLIRGVSPGDMPSFGPAFIDAYKALRNCDANKRHCIVISDGDPAQPSFNLVNSSYVDHGITTAAIVVMPHTMGNERQTMFNIASNGGEPETANERFYDINVTGKLRYLPQIFTREAVRVRQELYREGQLGGVPHDPADYTDSFPGWLPGLTGYVGVTAKPNTRQTLRILPDTGSGPDATATPEPLLVHWPYGVGKVACFTSDVMNPGWGSGWMGWSGYRRFWGDVANFIARQTRPDDERVVMRTDLDETTGRGRIVVHAYDPDGRPLTLESPIATIVDPALAGEDLRLQLVAPGRYEAWFDAPRQGAYQVHLASPIEGDAEAGGIALPVVLTGGVSVPYAREFRDMGVNVALLSTVATNTGGRLVEAQLVPAGTLAGVDSTAPELIMGDDRVIDPQTDEPVIDPATGEPRVYNPFSQDLPVTVSFTPIWQGFVVAALVLLLIDVFFRKVFVSWEQVTGTIAPVVSSMPVLRSVFVVPEEKPLAEMERLHAVKAVVAGRQDAERERRQKDVSGALAALQRAQSDRQRAAADDRERAAAAPEPPKPRIAIPPRQPEPEPDSGSFLKQLRKKAKRASARPPAVDSPANRPVTRKPDEPEGPPEKSGGGLFDRLKDVKRDALDDKRKRDD